MNENNAHPHKIKQYVFSLLNRHALCDWHPPQESFGPTATNTRRGFTADWGGLKSEAFSQTMPRREKHLLFTIRLTYYQILRSTQDDDFGAEGDLIEDT